MFQFCFQLLAVFEGVFTGQILCAACLSATSFVTGGTSTVCVLHFRQTKSYPNFFFLMWSKLKQQRS